MIGNRTRIIQAFSEAGNVLLETYWNSSYELANAHDIHGFYKLNANLAVHVQGYPGMSKENEMFVSMRLRDYKKMRDIRAKDEVSVGNEHESNLAFPESPEKLNSGIYLPYNGPELAAAINREAVRCMLTV